METKQNNSQTRRRTNTSGQSATRRSSQRTAGTVQRSAGAAQRQSAQRQTAQRRTSQRSTTQRSRSGQSNRSKSPDVVYTPAAPFSRGKLLIRLLTVVAVVMALVFGISIFFHVETITVSCAEKYEAWAVREASGLKEGDNLLSVNDAQVSGNIITKLPYVKNVRVGIKLPNTVNIYIEELDVVYAIRDTGNLWWLITGDGVVVENTDLATAGEYPQILGIALYKPVSAQPGVAQEPEAETPTETTEDGQTVPAPVTILGAQRLSAALDIVQYLEQSKLIDKVVSVDVSDMGNITVTYGQQYKINLGDTTQLKHKLELVTKGIPKLNSQYGNPVGIIDASLRVVEGGLQFTSDSLSDD